MTWFCKLFFLLSHPKTFLYINLFPCWKLALCFLSSSEAWWSSIFLLGISQIERKLKKFLRLSALFFLTASKGSKESYCFLIPIAFQHFHSLFTMYTILIKGIKLKTWNSEWKENCMHFSDATGLLSTFKLGSKVLALAKKVATLIYSREWFCSATLKALSRELTALATPGL